jgi:hypothetical protein
MVQGFRDIGERFSGHDVHVDAGRSNDGKLLMFLHSGRGAASGRLASQDDVRSSGWTGSRALDPSGQFLNHSGHSRFERPSRYSVKQGRIVAGLSNPTQVEMVEWLSPQSSWP